MLWSALLTALLNTQTPNNCEICAPLTAITIPKNFAHHSAPRSAKHVTSPIYRDESFFWLFLEMGKRVKMLCPWHGHPVD